MSNFGIPFIEHADETLAVDDAAAHVEWREGGYLFIVGLADLDTFAPAAIAEVQRLVSDLLSKAATDRANASRALRPSWTARSPTSSKRSPLSESPLRWKARLVAAERERAEIGQKSAVRPAAPSAAAEGHPSLQALRDGTASGVGPRHNACSGNAAGDLRRDPPRRSRRRALCRI